MKRLVVVLCAIIALLGCKRKPSDTIEPQEAPGQSTPFESQSSELNAIATVNVDYLRIRASPRIESSILGRLMKDTQVIVLKKTKEKEKVASIAEYWYELMTAEGIIGWAFGQFLTITNNQIDTGNFAAKYERGGAMPKQSADFSITNDLEKRKMYAEADVQYGKLPDSPFIRYLAAERKLLRRASFAWLRDDPRELYRGILNQIEKRDSIMPLLPPSIDLGTYASEFWGIFSNSELNSFILDNLENGHSISDLFILNDNQAVFYIDQTDWQSHGNRFMFCIFKLADTIYPRLNGKYELATVMFSTSASFSDPARRGFSINYPYYKLWVYGVRDIFKRY